MGIIPDCGRARDKRETPCFAFHANGASVSVSADPASTDNSHAKTEREIGTPEQKFILSGEGVDTRQTYLCSDRPAKRTGEGWFKESGPGGFPLQKERSCRFQADPGCSSGNRILGH